MKVYILKVKSEFQPPTISVVYPAHNGDFKDGEEVFHKFILEHPEILTDDPNEADWHYLPIYWTHWMVNHKFGRIDLDKLQAECDEKVINPEKTFTIHEYAEQPQVHLERVSTFLGSRTASSGFDMPLLCRRHGPLPEKGKKYLASFVGAIGTHPIRREMQNKYNRPDVHIAENKGTAYFIDTMLVSFISLCPRGYGGASYRFYEAMDLGVVPVLIGDIDHRPFKKFLDWDSVSFYYPDIDSSLEVLGKDRSLLQEMGRKAQQMYNDELANGNWCKYIGKELENG